MVSFNSYPDIESPTDMVCPYCRNPLWGAYVAEMETEYDADEGGVYREDYVTKWACEKCDHEFSEDEALSLSGVIEDAETPHDMRVEFMHAQDYFNTKERNKKLQTRIIELEQALRAIDHYLESMETTRRPLSNRDYIGREDLKHDVKELRKKVAKVISDD